ncbi:oxaloacetate tautomerase fahd-1, mitochondrial [Anabrus simplex]|uniref:oxaloacetate tautomerase fahd-1, mitochondrial n=1 Tax=Anabrus simplex TaxID=316456 RepID=UPI0034DDA847
MSLCNFHLTGKKIIGAILNYKAGFAQNATVPKQPIVFLKASSSYITEGQCIELPPGSTAIHEEVELGVIIGKKGKNISESQALEYVGGYCLALDMTDMKTINEAKSSGFPWTVGKCFDTSCPVSRLVSCKELPDPGKANLWCRVNGELVQNACTDDLLFSVPALISYLSSSMTLEPGDLILTGCPPGSTAVSDGDIIQAGLGDILTMEFPVKCAAK